MSVESLNHLSLPEVNSFIEQKMGVVIDTMVPEHFQARHIPGAVNACVHEMVFVSVVAEVVPDKSESILLYGAGAQSMDCRTAAEKLHREGYTNVSVFPGGLEEWQAAGLALEGNDVDQAAPPPALSLQRKVYSLVPEESMFLWVGRSTTARHHGTIDLARGELDATGDPAAGFVLDMSTIRNINLEGDELKPVLEAHLMSDDFFFTELFPTATFETTAIKLVEDGEATRPNAMMQGPLTMRGMSQEIAFPIHIRNLEDGKLVVIGNLDFDRTQWGIIYGASRFFQHLGYHIVYDFISVDFRLVLV